MITWTTVEERIVWTATADPSYQFVTLRPTSVTLESGGGGGGAVDSVNGETGVVVLDAADVGAVDVALVGAANGIAELDSGGLVPSSQLPSYVDDVIEAANFAALPGTGATGKIYVTLDNNLTFRWSGSAYVEISASLALGETSSTAYRGDRGKTAYDHSQVVTGNPHGTTAGDITSGTFDAARIPDLDAAKITTGTVAQARLGSGSAGAGTKFLADDQTYKTVSSGIADPGGSNDDFLQRKAGAWTNRTVAQVKTDLGVIEKLPRTSGEYYTLGGAEASSITAGQAGSGAAGRMVAHPVWLPAGSYDRACVRTTVAAVATYRIGVYPNDAATMRPDGTTLILDCGTIDMNATAGLLSATVTLSIPTSGIYWLAILMDSYTAAPSAFGWNGNVGVTPNLPYLGHRNFSSVGGRGTWGALKTGVTTGSMPGTFPTSTTATDIMPQILVRAT